MPEVERGAPFVAELFPTGAPGVGDALRALSTTIATRMAALPKTARLVMRTRDALDEPNDPEHDSRARRAILGGAASNLILALWDPHAAQEISPTGQTLLHVAACTPLEKVFPDAIDRLVRHGVPVNATEAVLDNTALHLAVERCVNTPVSTVCDDRYQRRAMLRRVERLLAHGANPNLPNLFGHTALHQVFCQRGLNMAGHPIPWPLIAHLMKAGADPFLTNRVGIAPALLLEAALHEPVPTGNPGTRAYWAQPFDPRLHLDPADYTVAREAVALRLGLSEASSLRLADAPPGRRRL